MIGNNHSKPIIIRQRPKLPVHVSLFTSLSIIILAFFILLTAYSTFDVERVKMALTSVQLEFVGIFEKAARMFSIFETGSAGQELTAEASKPGNELLYDVMTSHYEEFRALQKYADQIGLEGSIGIIVTPRGMVVTMGEELTFAPGDDRLTPQGRRFLDRLVAIVGPFRNEIAIEGHTDTSQLPPGGTWRNNWELSQARAMSVLSYLNSRGIGIDRLSAGGAGEYRPLVANDTPANMALNRRVEVIIKHPRLERSGEMR
ncbi:MAG TPA: flagellar motor protein MotB [Acidobacteriota bacterium]|nr:flagellar motor protein MotB [Acidobacteriota bacterium]